MEVIVSWVSLYPTSRWQCDYSPLHCTADVFNTALEGDISGEKITLDSLSSKAFRSPDLTDSKLS